MTKEVIDYEFPGDHEVIYDVEKIASVCHEANKAYCEAIGDNTQVSWENAPEWQKESAINGVKYKIDNPDVTPEKMHENWVKDKKDAGWMYGEVKDVAAKTHPCIVDYHDLPKQQQRKDALFSAIVKAMTD